MRIAKVTEIYPPEVNRVARTVPLFAEGLRRRVHQIQLVHPRQGPDDRVTQREVCAELLRPGIAVRRYPQLRFGVLSTGMLARAIAERLSWEAVVGEFETALERTIAAAAEQGEAAPAAP